MMPTTFVAVFFFLWTAYIMARERKWEVLIFYALGAFYGAAFVTAVTLLKP